MGFFSKSVTDDEWLKQAKPLYEASLSVTTALNEAASDSGSMDDKDILMLYAIDMKN